MKTFLTFTGDSGIRYTKHLVAVTLIWPPKESGSETMSANSPRDTGFDVLVDKDEGARQQGDAACGCVATDHRYRRESIHGHCDEPEKGQLVVLEVRHRLRAQCEDRIRNTKDSSLTKLPFRAFVGNALWRHVVMLSAEIMAWTQ